MDIVIAHLQKPKNEKIPFGSVSALSCFEIQYPIFG